MKENVLLESKEEYQLIYSSEVIYLPGNFISSEFIKRILTRDNYYDYALRFFKGQINEFKVGYIRDDKIYSNISYSKSEILLAMEIYFKQNNLQSNNEYMMRYQVLRNEISLDAFKKRYQEEILNLKIDNIDYQIPVKDIIDFLSKSNYEFQSICDDNRILSINKIKKEHFVYAMQYFLKRENVVDNYLLTNGMNKNIKNILDNYYDVEAINQYLETKDKLYQQFEIDEELEKAIFSEMPKDLSDLEKSIYIYIKMCQLLTYDEEFHALNQEGEVTLKHQDVRNVGKINLQNNRVTCYEFNILFAKLLDKLNIHFASTYREFIDESGYGKTHVNLTYRVGKYLVFADAAEGIFHGDIASAKVNKRVNGLNCLNKNDKTKEEFQDAMDKIKEIIYTKEPKENLDDLVREYQKKTNNYHEISLEEKIHIMFEKLKIKDYKGIDAMSYALHLKRILFNYNELNFNVKFNIVCNTETKDDKLARLSLIIRVNEDDLEDMDNTHYFIFTPQEELKEISYEELKEMFDQKIFSYLESDNNYIDGISRGVK